MAKVTIIGADCAPPCAPVPKCAPRHCGCHTVQEHHHYPTHVHTTNNYYGRPVHIEHAHQQCCHAHPNMQHHHQHHCHCNHCSTHEPMQAIVPSGTEGQYTMFAGLPCGEYMISRSENSLNSSLAIDGTAVVDTVGTRFTVPLGAAGNLVYTFTAPTATAGYIEVVKVGECEGTCHG